MTWEAFCQSLPGWLLIWAGLTADVAVVCFIAGFFTEAYRQHRKKLHDEFVARIQDASNEEIEAAYRRKEIIDFAEYYKEMCRRDRQGHKPLPLGVGSSGFSTNRTVPWDTRELMPVERTLDLYESTSSMKQESPGFSRGECQRERMHRVMDDARMADERLKLETLLNVHQLRHAPSGPQTFYADNVAYTIIPSPYGTTERK